MIICFEGPSGVGKTTIAELFSASYHIVPEVNLLFQRDVTASDHWYLEKQVERYQLGLQSKQDTILDGDIFQPLWYNWVYGYPASFLSEKETYEFYLKNIQKGHVAFPDLYFVFHINEQELRNRKDRDISRARRNFEKHLKLIQPQQEYFEFLKNRIKMDIHFIENQDIYTTKDQIENIIANSKRKGLKKEAAFKDIINWLKTNKL